MCTGVDDPSTLRTPDLLQQPNQENALMEAELGNAAVQTVHGASSAGAVQDGRPRHGQAKDTGRLIND